MPLDLPPALPHSPPPPAPAPAGPPPPPTFTLDRRASDLLDLVAPLRQWRAKNCEGSNLPAELRTLAERIDALQAEVHRYVGQRLEPYPA